MVCAPVDQGNYPWGCIGTNILNTSTTVGSGAANTSIILAGCTQRPIAASECDDLALNGYSDWYLPTLDELQMMRNRLYLQGLGGFSGYSYMSSSQYDLNHCYAFSFTGGWSDGIAKNGYIYGQVRAVRAF